MNFKEEIDRCIRNVGGFSLQISSSGGYFTGVKRILDLTDEIIRVQTNDKRIITVQGKAFTVQKLDDSDLAFCGKIAFAEVKQA